MTLTLDQLQVEHANWVVENFGEQQSYQPLLGAMEELGELAHAHLKAEQAIRGTIVEHTIAKIDAIGDIIIFLANYCTLEGISLQQCVEQTWSAVKQRNWKADPTNGQGNVS